MFTDLLYRQTVPINGTPVELEVIDVSGSNSDKFPSEQVNTNYIIFNDIRILIYRMRFDNLISE